MNAEIETPVYSACSFGDTEVQQPVSKHSFGRFVIWDEDVARVQQTIEYVINA
jgi:hypothetical protein